MNAIQLHCEILLALCQCFCFKISTSQNFDEVYTGIVFSPFVKHLINGSTSFPPWSSYTETESRVMLETILEKFSKVATWNAGSKNVSYIRNITYYNDSYVSAYTAEIAANINRRHGGKRITILQGIWQDFGSPQMETEIQLAIEGAEKANKIYPGTVEGIILLHKAIAIKYEQAEQTKKHLNFLKKSSVRRMKFGTAMDCNKIFTDYAGESIGKRQTEIIESILQDSDFVLCTTDAISHTTKQTPFYAITNILLQFRTKLQKRNANLKVMGFLSWADANFQKWEGVKEQKMFWENLSQWAKQNSFPLWFYEAFDNPWRNTKGWWRLADNSKSYRMDGYIEKISEHDTPKDPMSFVYIGIIVVAISVVLILVAVIVFQIYQGKKLQQISNQDVREFMEGISDETLPQQSDHIVDIPGEKLPYDNSLEIDKNHLKIDTQSILGTGQFGRVFKAVIERHGKEDEHVALKISKQNCSRSCLREILSEIKVMSYIGNHPNVVALRGVYTAELQNGRVYIATELCSLGSLESHLRQQEKMPNLSRTYVNVSTEVVSSTINPDTASELITLQEMLKWCHDIACGMEFLGTKNVVHADLATRNVLLTGEKVAKISDFGLSRRMYNYTNYVKSKTVPLPWRWMAIESLKWGEFSVKSDVWSYGITLWEIFSYGEMPFPGLVWTPTFVKMLVDGTRLESPCLAPPEIYNLMTSCWQKNKEDRPDFSKICQAISDIISGQTEGLI